MDSNESGAEGRTQIVTDLGRMLRREARGRWSAVRVASRVDRGHQVWRFRAGPEGGERFLHVSLQAIDRAKSSGRQLFRHLRKRGWLSRLDEGGETALRLGVDGKLESLPVA